MDEEKKIRLRHTAAQVDDGIDKANAAAPQDSTYNKQAIDNMIPDVDALSAEEIDTILSR